jgi:osmotically-inducible protein OsmY
VNQFKSDLQLKQDVEAELRWDPRVNAAQIGVTVDQGAVTLLGAVDSYAGKCAAEEATRRVSGVLAVAQDLTVKLLTDHARTDGEIAAAVLAALRWNVFVPEGVTAKVQAGAVTLEGTADWHYEREAAERAVRYLAGVVTVRDLISLSPKATAEHVGANVQAALQRQAEADAHSIRITTSGSTVTLSGHASSWQAIDDATTAAWAAPGVTEVVDHIQRSITA